MEGTTGPSVCPFSLPPAVHPRACSSPLPPSLPSPPLPSPPLHSHNKARTHDSQASHGLRGRLEPGRLRAAGQERRRRRCGRGRGGTKRVGDECRSHSHGERKVRRRRGGETQTQAERGTLLVSPKTYTRLRKAATSNGALRSLKEYSYVHAPAHTCGCPNKNTYTKNKTHTNNKCIRFASSRTPLSFLDRNQRNGGS